jgi:medium-chain acyl-[acyl-carrier-protein] hydrolase
VGTEEKTSCGEVRNIRRRPEEDCSRTRNRWIAFRVRREVPSVRLFCLPYAGAGAYPFRGWGNAVPNDVEVCPVELPGRGTRLGEAPASELKSLVRQMAAGVEPLLDLPFAIFGCSMGALIGFELARLLRQRYGQEPATLLVAAQNAPSTIPGPTGIRPYGSLLHRLRKGAGR